MSCPICQHTDGCRELSPGFWSCLRTRQPVEGWIYCGEARNGMGGLFRHPDAAAAPPGPPPQPKFDLGACFKRFWDFLRNPGPLDWVPGGEPPPEPPPREPDLRETAELMASWARRDGILEYYAKGLHLPVRALIRLGCGVHPGTRQAKRGKGLAFPERDGTGRVVGIAYRGYQANKFFETDTHRGLTYCDGWDQESGPVISPEGGSCTLAGIALGLATVGRPSNVGGIEFLAELWAGQLADRPLVIIGENDKKTRPDGTVQWSGRDGTLPSVRRLASLLGRPIWFCLPPPGFKDVRDWVVSLRIWDDPDQVATMKDAFLDYLEKEHIVIEVTAEEREETLRQEEVRQEKAAYWLRQEEARQRVAEELAEARLEIPDLAKLVDELTFEEPDEPDDRHWLDDVNPPQTPEEREAARVQREAAEQAKQGQEDAQWHARRGALEEGMKQAEARYGPTEPAGERRGTCGCSLAHAIFEDHGTPNGRGPARVVHVQVDCGCAACMYCRPKLLHHTLRHIDKVFQAMPGDCVFVSIEGRDGYMLPTSNSQRVALRITVKMDQCDDGTKNIILCMHESYLKRFQETIPLAFTSRVLDKEEAYWQVRKWVDRMPITKRPIGRSSLLYDTVQPFIRTNHASWTEEGMLGDGADIQVFDFPLRLWARKLALLGLKTLPPLPLSDGEDSKDSEDGEEKKRKPQVVRADGYVAYLQPKAMVRLFTRAKDEFRAMLSLLASQTLSYADARKAMDEAAGNVPADTANPVWVSESWAPCPEPEEPKEKGNGDGEDYCLVYVRLPRAHMQAEKIVTTHEALGADVTSEETGDWRKPRKIVAEYDRITIKQLQNLGAWMEDGQSPDLEQLDYTPATWEEHISCPAEPPDAEPFSGV